VFYELEQADVVAFIPVDTEIQGRHGSVRPFSVPAAELAVAVHAGPLSEIDHTRGESREA
jgi:hypothetical protein